MESSDSPIPPERWIANLIEVADEIADKEIQERRWLASDAYAWERPEELINSLFDDCNFELFLQEFSDSFSTTQHDAALRLRDEIQLYNDATPTWLDPEAVLADPRWHAIREAAIKFSQAFRNNWPMTSPSQV